MTFVKWPKLRVWHIARPDGRAATLCYLVTSPELLRTKRRPLRVCTLCNAATVSTRAQRRRAKR